MAEMAVGGAIGQNMAGTLNNMMSGMNQSSSVGTVPPPIPSSMYNVAVDGQATGPYDINTLKQMTITGQFGEKSLVWKAGMTEWVQAGFVDELKSLFANIMPPIPQS
jgi:hypothetical protein